MFNMNNSLMVGVSEGVGNTPRTPEILNSLMSMTNPFEMIKNGHRIAASPPSDSTSASSSPPSVQHTCSQLIKEGLKHSIQSKIRHNSESSIIQEISIRSLPKAEEVSQDSLLGDASGDGLTPEDEERRRRRRERNKIAATKCRLKKREKTVNLVQESELLETQNHDLKSQINELQSEKDKLVKMLSIHGNCCKKNAYTNTASPYPDHFQRCTTTPVHDGNSNNYYPSPSAYHKTHVTCESSISYHRSSTVETNSFRRIGQPDERYCRVSTNSTNFHNFEDGVLRDPAVMLPYCHPDDTPETYMRSETIYTNLNVSSPHNFINSQDSPTGIYNRPSSLSLNTSSSDYESTTEMLDSPNVTPNNYHHYDDDTGSYPTGFPAGSCIS